MRPVEANEGPGRGLDVGEGATDASVMAALSWVSKSIDPVGDL